MSQQPSFWAFVEEVPGVHTCHVLQLQPAAVVWASGTTRAMAAALDEMRAGRVAAPPGGKSIDVSQVVAVEVLDGSEHVWVRDAAGVRHVVFRDRSHDDAIGVARELAIDLGMPPTCAVRPAPPGVAAAAAGTYPLVSLALVAVVTYALHAEAESPDADRIHRFGRAGVYGTYLMFVRLIGPKGFLVLGGLLGLACLRWWLRRRKFGPRIRTWGQPTHDATSM